ncbi:hypothetical protein [Gorillibacterium massiliense]|uniref:hypothetical protein n=1 Tax=Gorillibacterium massiliense TaxID=1280390 RepID=UPI0004B3DF21|nr:hypothetical protein [Gorillibacterium massiliense]
MMLVFRDNFFSSGVTEIVDEAGERAGELDLKSAFSSAADVYDRNGSLVYSGKFPFFSNKWVVSDRNEIEVGNLRYRMSFMSKRYEYDAGGRGIYEITSPAFSKEYEIRSEAGVLVADFSKISGWFDSGAFALNNHSDQLDSYELVCVILGMHQIVKRHNSAAASH